MSRFDVVIPKSKAGKERLLGSLVAALGTNPIPDSHKQVRRVQPPAKVPRPEWRCSRCRQTNWETRPHYRQCGHTHHARSPTRSPSRPRPSPARRDPPAAPAPAAADQDVDMDGDDDSLTDVAAGYGWPDMSLSQLKQEQQRLLHLQRQTQEAKLCTKQLTQRIDYLQRYSRTRLSDGQRIDNLQAQIKREIRSQEVMHKEKEELEKKLAELGVRICASVHREKELQSQLDAARTAIANDTSVDASEASTPVIQTAMDSVWAELRDAGEIPENSQGVQLRTVVEHAMVALVAKLSADKGLPPTPEESVPLPPTVPDAQPPETMPASNAELAAQQELPQSYGVVARQPQCEHPYAKATPPVKDANGAA